MPLTRVKSQLMLDLTFGRDGERRLTDWMTQHAQVVWTATDHPWKLEQKLIRSCLRPLNLDQNRHSPFHDRLTALRAAQRTLARSLPVEQ
jgi:hypothetical protein